jgi:dynein heavy chain, axonemal
MVSQISIIGNDIKKRIKEIESFSLFIIFQSNDNKNNKNSIAPTGIVGIKLLKSTIKADSVTPDTEIIKKEQQQHQHQQKKTKKIMIKESDDAIKPIFEYFNLLKESRNENVLLLEDLYNSIGPILRKLESIIVGTCTGDSEKMKFYYTYWEKELFAALSRYVGVVLVLIFTATAAGFFSDLRIKIWKTTQRR